MKHKTVCLLLCLALLTALCPAAAAAESVYVSFSDPTVLVNDDVTVNIHASVPIAGISLNLAYDEEYLEYRSQWGGMGNASVNAGGGAIAIVDYDSTGQSDFTLSLSFHAKKTGTTTIRVTACSVSDAGGDSMDAAWGSAAVTITSASSDATLQSLFISPGTLSPAFAPSISQYTATVAYETTWIAVTAVRNDSAASTFVQGHDSLRVGQNTVTVTVTAGDGSQRVYTILVTRQSEAAATPTPVPPATAAPQPTPTPESKKVYAKVADGSLMEIGAFDVARMPAGYQAGEIEYSGVIIPVAIAPDGRTAAYLLANAGNEAGFYFLDAELGVATPMNILEVRGSYTILDAGEWGTDVPALCTLQSYTLAGVACRVFVPERGDYVIFYGENAAGTRGLYVYDPREQTVQRYIAPETAAPEETTAPANTLSEEEAQRLQEEKTAAETTARVARRTAGLAVIAALAMLAVVIVLAVLLIRRQRDD